MIIWQVSSDFFCLSFCIFAENCIFENPTMLDGYNPELKCQEIG